MNRRPLKMEVELPSTAPTMVRMPMTSLVVATLALIGATAFISLTIRIRYIGPVADARPVLSSSIGHDDGYRDCPACVLQPTLSDFEPRHRLREDGADRLEWCAPSGAVRTVVFQTDTKSSQDPMCDIIMCTPSGARDPYGAQTASQPQFHVRDADDVPNYDWMRGIKSELDPHFFRR